MRPLQLSVPAVAALVALSAVPADAGTPGSRGAAPVEVGRTTGAASAPGAAAAPDRLFTAVTTFEVSGEVAEVAAVTLQENNAIALVDLASRTVLRSFTAGSVVRTDADTADDRVVAFDDPLTALREPDAVQWTPDGNLVTADEGDLAGGGRGWTVFSPTGEVVATSGASAEQALAAVGRYPDGRSDDKGAEFEGAEVARLRGQDLLVVGSERGDAVLVHDLADERAPRLLQVLPTGDSPEGLLAVTRQGVFLTSNEGDGTISVFAIRNG